MNAVRLPLSLIRRLGGWALASAVLLAAPAAPETVPDTLDLPTAIGFALEHNFAIRQARERIRQLEYLALTKMRKAMARNESIRTAEEIDDENRQRERMAVIREFVESKSRRSSLRDGRN